MPAARPPSQMPPRTEAPAPDVGDASTPGDAVSNEPTPASARGASRNGPSSRDSLIRSSPLLASLKTLVPDEVRTLLLRAALLDGEARDQAWARLVEAGVDLPEVFRADTVGVKRLGPLLYLSNRDAGGERPAEWNAVLRTAYGREEMRTSEYAKILGNLIRALNEAGVEHVLLTGAALGYTVYEQPTLRHSHDIDLWVRPDSETDVVAAVEPAGFSSPRRTPLSGGIVTGLVHDSLLPTLLHELFFRIPGLGPDLESAWGESQKVEVLGAPTRVLAPHHALLRVCARTSLCAHRAGTQWVADAVHILRAGDVDWDAFVRSADTGQLAAPALVFLEYVKRELDQEIPEDALDRLEEAAVRTTPFTRDILLFGTRHHAPGRTAYHELDATPKATRELSRTLLFPSADYLRWSFGKANGFAPMLWTRRLLRALKR